MSSAVPPPPPPAPPPAVTTASSTVTAPVREGGGRGRCCLWGCIGMSLLLVAGALGAWGAYHYYGAPWLAAKKAQLVAAYPILARFIRIPAQPLKLAGGDRGSTDRGDFPPDLYLPADVVQSAFRITGKQALAVLTVGSRDLNSWRRKMVKGMLARGWEAEGVQKLHDGISLRFHKPDARLKVMLTRESAGIRIWILRSAGVPRRTR